MRADFNAKAQRRKGAKNNSRNALVNFLKFPAAQDFSDGCGEPGGGCRRRKYAALGLPRI